MKLPSYSALKPSGADWLGHVPKHWEVLSIKRLTPVSRGASPRPIEDPKYFDDEGEYAWVRIADVTSNHHYLMETTQRLSELGKSLSVPLEPGSLFLSIAGSVGKPMITAIKACIHDGFVYFPQIEINREFLYYIFESGQPYLGLGKFGTQLNLNTDTVGSIKIGLPPPSEQQQIAAFLDWKTGQIDALIARKKELLEKLKEKRLAVITQAVTRGLNPAAPLRDSGIPWLGHVPAHWELCHLKRKFRSVEYGISEALEPEGEVAILRMGNIENGKVALDDLKFIDSVPDGLLLQRGDLLYNRTNSLDLIGKVGMFTGGSEKPVSFASYLVRIRVEEGCLPEYFAYMLNTEGILGVARSHAFIAIGQCNLNPTRYGQIKAAIPPRHEQHAIVRFLDEETERIDTLVHKAQSAIARLTEYRTALITAATTGKIDVRGVKIPNQAA